MYWLVEVAAVLGSLHVTVWFVSHCADVGAVVIQDGCARQCYVQEGRSKVRGVGVGMHGDGVGPGAVSVIFLWAVDHANYGSRGAHMALGEEEEGRRGSPRYECVALKALV